ncbi:phage tail protein [Niallia sp. 01092]|uniref:phage tail protein n=1 Tax=unclassified Niallia TaxID=2837522 RepID=UPI003FD2AD0E
MMKTYTTKHGDTWDKIALDMYGSEYMLPVLLEANQKHRLTIIFKAGIVLNISEVDQEEETEDLPPWLLEDADDISADLEGEEDGEDTDDNT